MSERERPDHHPLFERIERWRRKSGRVHGDTVLTAHGGGGKAMRDLIDDVVVGILGDQAQVEEDQARFSLADLASRGDRLAYTTDSYVVSPLFFPGGDIGKLAVNGTVNDLAVGGAVPLFLSLGLIIEEGLPVETLRKVMRSVRDAAAEAGVRVVTGDTKVVQRGAADKLFLNTSGVGVIPEGIDVGTHRLRADDVFIVSGHLGDHGAAILTARGELNLEVDIPSDCAPLHRMVGALLAETQVHAMRDVTRGGLAASLNEMALSAEVGVVVDGPALPVRTEVAGFCELLGLDPVYLANEGKLLFAVPAAQAEQALAIVRGHPDGEAAEVIGRCRPEPPGVVTLDTGFGSERILDMLVGEQLPRIC